MNKELNIKVKLNSIEFNSTANLEDWNTASNEQKKTYVKSKIKEFLEDNLDQIINSSEITY